MADRAANPWHRELEPLPKETTGLSNEQILFGLADILEQWPGTPTAVLDDEEKHNRLVKVLSGYPDIDVATRPLDWPLHPRSVKALIISRALDDIPGIFLDSSLRSDILNRDMAGRQLIKKNPKEETFHSLTVACLSLLLSRVNTDNRSGAKEALLASFFSYDNVAGIRRGWEEVQEAIAAVPPSMKTMLREPNLPEEPKSTPAPEIETYKILGNNPNDRAGVSDEQYERWSIYDDYRERKSTYKKELNKFKNLKKYSFPNWDYEVTFQFCRIQTWLAELRMHDKGEGTCGRLLRGASLLLEAAISSIRDIVIQKYGPGSIIIDGGGRLRAIVPDKHSADHLCKAINLVYQLFLSIGPYPNEGLEIPKLIHKFPETHKRLERELKIWFDGFEYLKTSHPQKKMNKIIREFTETGMPPRRVYIREINEKKDIEDVTQLVSTLNRKLPPEKNPIQGGANCPFCDEDLSNLLENENSWGSADKWITNPSKYRNRKNKPAIVVCLVHRLCYIVGHHQRMKDSVLHRPRIDSRNEFENTILDDRPVVALAQLDGNSIGYLFKPPDEHNNPASMDAYRRRSFRFNAHWWPTLADSIFSINRNGGDPIGAWVVAGDDVILAEYGSHGPDNSTAMWLRKGLDSLVKSLNRMSGFNAELRACSNNGRAPYFTFTAGYTEKRMNPRERISPMLKRVNRIESRAKKQWKSRMTKNAPWMLNVEKRIYCIDWDEGNLQWARRSRNLIRDEDWSPKEGDNKFCQKKMQSTTFGEEDNRLICNCCNSIVQTTNNQGPVTTRIRWRPRDQWTEPLVEHVMGRLGLEKPHSNDNDGWQNIHSALDRSEISKKWSRWTLNILPRKEE